MMKRISFAMTMVCISFLVMTVGCGQDATQTPSSVPSSSGLDPSLGYVQEFRYEYDSLGDLIPQLPMMDTSSYCEEYNETYDANYSGQLPLIAIERIGDSDRFEAVYKGLITRDPEYIMSSGMSEIEEIPALSSSPEFDRDSVED